MDALLYIQWPDIFGIVFGILTRPHQLVFYCSINAHQLCTICLTFFHCSFCLALLKNVCNVTGILLAVTEMQLIFHLEIGQLLCTNNSVQLYF